VRAMRSVSSLPVTVKHRIGIDRTEDYDFMRRFVETVAAAGCATFIVHARNAILKGLSPKQNREIPPLRYELVHRLKREFRDLTIVINGGLTSWPAIDVQLSEVDGVMLGRAAENDPWLLVIADGHVFGEKHALPTRLGVVDSMLRYADDEVQRGTPLRHIARRMHGLYHGQPGARLWRQRLSDVRLLAADDPARAGTGGTGTRGIDAPLKSGYSILIPTALTRRVKRAISACTWAMSCCGVPGSGSAP
jgi:tRNA-dihydrouridine synthase A